MEDLHLYTDISLTDPGGGTYFVSVKVPETLIKAPLNSKAEFFLAFQML